MMVNNGAWHEKATPESCSKLVDDLKTRGVAALTGCHLRKEENPPLKARVPSPSL